MPLFEVLSNAIHAIDEAKRTKILDDDGRIDINILRYGDQSAFKEISNTDEYPIDSFEIIDNGIGLNDENYNSFQEFDSEYKIEIGGKGIGRLVCLKAFDFLEVNSDYKSNGTYLNRSFVFKKTVEGFSNYQENPSKKNSCGTAVILKSFQNPYKESAPRSIYEIARQILTHFQLYYIQGKQPLVVLYNQDGVEVNLNNVFDREFKSEILTKEFYIGSHRFDVHISKSYSAQSHKIHYCANERNVKDEYIHSHLVDLKYSILDEEKNKNYYYQVYVVGDLLNDSVNSERTGFNFPDKEEEDVLELEEMSLSKIRKNTIQCIEILLSDFLTRIREDKMSRYKPIVENKFPNYTALFKHRIHEVQKIPSGLNDSELDLKLYEIESEWRKEIREEGVDLLEKKKDITTLEEYKELYADFITQFNEIGQSDLARYVVHRKSVIDLLEKLIELSEDERFSNEDTIHSLFFPIREKGDTISTEKQNLWLLDERLTFNTLLASDKLFSQIEELGSNSKERTDLIIRKEEVFHSAALYSESKIPFESFTIVEFKRPDRNDYVYGDPKKDPIAQVRRYIRETIDGETKKKGREIKAEYNTPFYCYVVADIKSTLKYILDEESFTPTPDGIGYFRIYDTPNYKAYIEVLPFEKVLKDSKDRNKVLFDRLGLSSV